jgi:hypothetical protein
MAATGIEGGVRAARLAAFSVTAMVLALGAHVLAGGPPPALLPTVAAVALPALAAGPLTRRRRGLLEIAVVLGAVQLALHEVFAAAATGPLHATGHVHAMGHADAATGLTGHSSLTMTGAHVVAVALTAALLTRGERLWHLLVTWWRVLPRLVRDAVGLLPVPAPAPMVPVVRPAGSFPSYRAAGCVVRRGPPPRVC